MIHMTEQKLVREKSYVKEDDKDDISQLSPSIAKENLTLVKGVGSRVSQWLNKANIFSVSDLAHSTSEDLSDIKGIGPSTAIKIIDEAKLHLRTKKLSEFSVEGGDVKLKNIQINDTQLEPALNRIDDDSEESGDTLVAETGDFEENENIVDGYEEDGELSRGSEGDDFEGEIVHSELSINEEVIPPADPVDLKPQIESQEFIPPTFETGPFIEQEVGLTLSPEVHQGGEIISLDESHQLEVNVRERLEENGFRIIEKTAQLQDVIFKIDILAVKFVTDFSYRKKKSNGLTDLIIIIPVVLSDLKGPLIVSANKIEYSAIEVENDFYVKMLPMSFLDTLRMTEETIRTNLLEEAALFQLFNEFPDIKLSCAKTFTKKNLYFYSRGRQFEILIEPLVISQNKVGFKEKILPFAYHKDSNTHVLQLEQLSDYLDYIEKKYVLLESYTEKKSLLVLHSKSGERLGKGLLFTIGFAIYGLVFITIFASQAYSLLSFVINLGFGLIALWAITVLYLVLGYSKSVSNIKREFSTPYYKRNLHLDNPSLELINENLASTLMEQFSYECLGKNSGFKIIEKIERENSQNFLQNKTIRKKVNETDLFEEENTQEIKNQNSSKVKNERIRKYSSFLED